MCVFFKYAKVYFFVGPAETTRLDYLWKKTCDMYLFIYLFVFIFLGIYLWAVSLQNISIWNRHNISPAVDSMYYVAI